MWDCGAGLHLVVDDQDDCTACGQDLQPGDRVIRVTTPRILGELMDPADRASIREWGHAGLDGDA